MFRSHPAFTLIELLVVVAMIGLLVLIAAPQIDLMRYRANTAVQVLGTTVLTAQRQALTQQHDVVVRFDTLTRRLRVHQDRNNNGAVDTGEHVRAVPLGESIEFGRGDAPQWGGLSSAVTFTRTLNSEPALIFRRDGSASEAGGFYVTTRRGAAGSGDFADDSRLVVVERSTGRATAYRYLDGQWRKVF